MNAQQIVFFISLLLSQDLGNAVGGAVRGQHRQLCDQGQCILKDDTGLYTSLMYCSLNYYTGTCTSQNPFGFANYVCGPRDSTYGICNVIASGDPCSIFDNGYECQLYNPGYGCSWTCSAVGTPSAPVSPPVATQNSPVLTYDNDDIYSSSTGGASGNSGGGDINWIFWIVGIGALILVIPAVILARYVRKERQEDRPLRCLLGFLGVYFGGAAGTAAATV